MTLDTDISLSHVIIRLIVSLLIGIIIGMEREIQHKSAGLRTSVLICLGSTIFTLGSLAFMTGNPNADPSRIAAQIVTGIGFLGAGAIIQTRGSVHGLTTAATIWAMSALGLAVGLGAYVLAIGGAVLVLGILHPLQALEKAIKGKKTTWNYVVTVHESEPALSHVVEAIQASPSVVKQLNVKKDGDMCKLTFNYTEQDERHAGFIHELTEMSGVVNVAANQES